MRLKTTSKESQKLFIESISSLFDDPQKLLPKCLDPGLFCPINSYAKKLKSGKDFSKYLKSADQLMSAVAETQKVSESDSIPFLGMVKTPLGSVEYAKKGETDPLVLAGVQHFSNPIWRMLAFSSISRTRGLRLYSTKSLYLSSCKNSSPGTEFFKSALEDEGIQYSIDGTDIFVGSGPNYFRVTHLGAVSLNLGSDSSSSTVHSIMKHILTPDFQNDFHFSMDFLEVASDQFPSKAVDSYLSGKMNDRTFYRETADYRLSQAISGRYIIIGSDLYSTPEEFVSKHEFLYVPKPLVQKAIEESGKGLYMDAFSERKVLEHIWPSAGKEILHEMFPDADSSLISSLKGSPIEQIDSLNGEGRISDFMSKLNIRPWSDDSRFLLQILGDYYTSGKERAMREGERIMGTSMNRRAIFYAFLSSVGEAANREWQFSQNEKELSFKISGIISDMIRGEPEHLSDLFEAIKPFLG